MTGFFFSIHDNDILLLLKRPYFQRHIMKYYRWINKNPGICFKIIWEIKVWTRLNNY